MAKTKLPEASILEVQGTVLIDSLSMITFFKSNDVFFNITMVILDKSQMDNNPKVVLG